MDGKNSQVDHGVYIGTKGSKVCQENIPNTITPPGALTVDKR